MRDETRRAFATCAPVSFIHASAPDDPDQSSAGSPALALAAGLHVAQKASLGLRQFHQVQFDAFLLRDFGRSFAM